MYCVWTVKRSTWPDKTVTWKPFELPQSTTHIASDSFNIVWSFNNLVLFRDHFRMNSAQVSLSDFQVSLMRCKWQIENSTWRIAAKILYSPNRTNRSNRHASTRVPEDREIFLSVASEMQMADRKLYLSDGPKILYLPNRTNRSNRQASTRVPEDREIFLSVANEM